MARRGPPAFAKPKPFNQLGVGNSRFLSREARKATYGEEWPEVRASVLRRDNYTCQRCDLYLPPPRQTKLDVHHKIPLPRGTNAQSNLTTLCKPCHALEHKHLEKMGYGKPAKGWDR